ncbi:MAG: nicotinate (nicotinamide) nucleotide adenylyltransferase [Acidimicrobiaceae bacterium]|jgi:nicotinate-nucleotide adenylyltransferase|nr:nicotinate (nicotinamide) nucleotide adenylyltransferase [Acidimicrobiaceae bacterium]|tara:strand:- start:6856 stop:7437 length:582 start_codon:yes stop_codon:yes gene_type:complete
MKIGVFGGTFDPPHNAHFSLVKDVMSVLSLDKVLVIVANDPWQKTINRQITDARHRLEMTELLFLKSSRIVVSDIEFQIGGKSDTAITLKALSEIYQDAEFWLMLGYDSAITIETWLQPKSVLNQAKVVVVDRPGSERNLLPPSLAEAIRLRGSNLDISSHSLREMIGRGVIPLDSIPHSVVEYISQNGLYRE